MKTSKKAWALREKRDAAKRVFPGGFAMIAFSLPYLCVGIQQEKKKKVSKEK